MLAAPSIEFRCSYNCCEFVYVLLFRDLRRCLTQPCQSPGTVEYAELFLVSPRLGVRLLARLSTRCFKEGLFRLKVQYRAPSFD